MTILIVFFIKRLRYIFIYIILIEYAYICFFVPFGYTNENLQLETCLSNLILKICNFLNDYQ